MKKTYISMALCALLLSASSCDKNFEEINTNPNLATNLDPIYLFNGAQFNAYQTTHAYPAEIVQIINTPYTGILEGGNHNVAQDANANPYFNNIYNNSVRNLIVVIEKTKDDATQSNLYNMARILKAYDFMTLVDSYGDVPYFEAGKAFLESNYQPKYDDQKIIYDDIIKELKEASAGLDATKPTVSGGDIFYSGDIAKWKKLANSLLLRAGMRYTDFDEAIAKTTVAAAVALPGGFMTSNADNAFVKFNTATLTNGTSAQLIATERSNFFAGKAFVDFMKANNDPRAKYIFVKYSNPGDPTGGTVNANLAEQNGLPYGYTDATIKDAPGWLGSLTAYSYFNRATVLRLDAPGYLVTYAQTQLLLAEAAQRGYIGTPDEARTYYENGIKGHMEQMKDYGVTLTAQEMTDYLLQPNVAYNPGDALKQINEQYWVASFGNWVEAWANFRRSGYPQLQPINYPGEDASIDDPKYNAQGFIRRLPYPNRELSVNTINVNEAITRMGGNTLGNRIFWDKN